MEVSMLDYMTRGIEWNTRQKLIAMMYPNNDGMFNFLIREFLRDPYTTNKYKLLAIPNYKNPEVLESTRQTYRDHFAKINQMCIENGIYPFFEDPSDIAKCESTRHYLVRKWPEWLLNQQFNVDSYYQYTPPAYNPNVPNPQDT